MSENINLQEYESSMVQASVDVSGNVLIMDCGANSLAHAFKLMISARNTSTQDKAAFFITALVASDGTDATIVDYDVVPYTESGLSTMVLSLDVDGNDLLLKATNASNVQFNIYLLGISS